MKHVSDRVYQLKLGPVNVFFIEDNGLTLVDTGLPGNAERIISSVKRIGKKPGDIKRIILTHCHTDHAGSAAALKNLLGIPVFAHPADAALVEQGISGRPGKLTPGIINWLLYHLLIKKSGQRITPVTVDETLSDADEIPVAGGIRIIHTPGHSAGHISLLVKNQGLLIAGDICSNVFHRLAYSPLYENRETGRASIIKAAGFSFEQAVFGHGSPLRKQGNLRLLEKFIETAV